ARAAAGGDELTVSQALDRVFDSQRAAPAARAAAGVAGQSQNVRQAIAQKIGIANTSSPADAPGLYLDAIKTAQDALPAPVADAIGKVVRGFATHKADASLDDLAASAYRAAVSGAAPETKRLLSAFDKWETVLGAPGRPLVTNAEALKSDVSETLEKAASGGAPSAPHVWFSKKDGSYTAVLPGGGVAAVPALAAAFAIAPSALAPETALGDAYRSFAADPRASTGAGLIYRARRALGSSVPSAALSAGRFWLRAALEAAWKRLVAFFHGRTAYRLSEKSGQDALRRDWSSARKARGEAAAAQRLFSSERPTVAGLRAAFGLLGRAAVDLGALTGDVSASEAVDGLSRAFETEASARSLRAGDAWPGAGFIASPGGPAHWARRIEAEAGRVVDERFGASLSGAEFANLGADRSPAVDAAASLRELSPVPAAMVALDDRLWAAARGSHGQARLSVELRPGGSVALFVEKGDARLSRRLEDLGFAVRAEGAGLSAEVGPQDFARDGAELGLLGAQALRAALGGAEPETGGLRELEDAARRDSKSAAALAALLDGREAFARARVIGLVGDYVALEGTPVVVGAHPLVVSALRDPDTGLLKYARAVKPNGAPLGAAELRALLRAK
ncbi:MAG: hypothetical protein KGL74_02135, partial [Elusimicrobia bacterium]|nr:hypothetical protein [Elusimicrobiota bacterium]